jgi:glycosyltransferase involved in cell wall biosynthesis
VKPSVSVVIATYNYGRYIAGALDSVLGQTFTDYEVIIVDDGSTDDTPRVVEPYLGDARTKYIRTEHLGQPAAKNTGIRAGTGEFVAFLDADDVWLSTKLEKQVALFRTSSEDLAVIYCRRFWMDEQGNPLDATERQPLRGDVLGPLFWRPFICFSSATVRRSVLEEVGLFDESIPMSIDYDLWLRIGLKYHFDYVDEALVKYRIGHPNLSSRLAERMVCVQKIVFRFLDEYGGRERLDPRLVRLALAEHYRDMASTLTVSSPARAVLYYFQSLVTSPTYWTSWKELASFWWPEPLRRRARMALAWNRRDDLGVEAKVGLR